MILLPKRQIILPSKQRGFIGGALIPSVQSAAAEPHKYWRITQMSTQGSSSWIGIAQIRLYSNQYDDYLTRAANGSASVSSQVNNSNNANDAIDNYWSTGWFSDSVSASEWWKFTFDTPQSIDRYELSGAKAGASTTYGLRSWELQYSDDNTIWEVYHSVNNISAMSAYEVREYSADSQPTPDFPVFDPALSHDSLITLNKNRELIKTTDSTWRTAVCDSARSSGKYYFEFRIDASSYPGGYPFIIGVGTLSASNNTYVGDDSNGWACQPRSGTKYHSSNTSITIAAPGQGSVIQCAVDIDAGKIWFGTDNNWSGDPSAGTGEAFSGLPTALYPMVSLYDTWDRGVLLSHSNLSHYSPPSGFSYWPA